MSWGDSRFVYWAATAFFTLFAIQISANAMEGGQSPYFKGYRDFLTGVLPSPGVQIRQDAYIYRGNENSTIPQGQLGIGLRMLANILGVTVITPHQIFGGDYAFAVRAGVTNVQVNQTVVMPKPRPTITNSGDLTALNDVVVSPIIVGWHVGDFHWNISTQVFMPAGNFDKSRVANTGKNAWAVSPQFGATYFDPRSGWEVSGAAIYLISARNTDTNYRSGDIVHFDFAAGKMLSPQFKLGVVGYYVQQLAADSGSGAIAGDRKLRVAGVGPGVSYVFLVKNVPVNLIAKYYREFDAQNTTQGNVGNLSVRVKF